MSSGELQEEDEIYGLGRRVRMRLVTKQSYEDETMCTLKWFKKHIRDFAPYALHLAMVVAVGIYVIAGAIAIRHIEAIPTLIKIQEGEPNAISDGSKVRRSSDQYVLSSQRTRTCVLDVLRRMAEANCTKIQSSLHVLDECYEKDLQQLANMNMNSRNDEKVETPTEETSTNSTNTVLINGYEYWTIMDSVLFCFTVITTIGYGNVAPRTFEGRMFVIFYGLIGVPFTMLAIANLGKFLAALLKTWTRPFLLMARRLKKRCTKDSSETKEKQRLMEKSKKKAKQIEEDTSSCEDVCEEEEEEADENEETEGFVLFLAFIVYIVGGSIVIAAYEPNMDFFEAIYFNFVTLTTIGLGDLVPQSDTYLVITLVYCAVGLALTTIAIEIAADTLKKLHYFGRKIDNVANVQVWFGGKKISMKALVKNLGDQFNVPIDELDNLDLGTFVDNAIKVQEGELATLRNDRAWMNSNYWRALESSSVHYVDDDDILTMQSNRNYYSEF